MIRQALATPDHCFLEVFGLILRSREGVEPEVEKAMESEDAVLIRQIRAGRTELIDILIRKHSDRLYHVILQLVQSAATAEDLLQDTWLLVIRNLHKFDLAYPFPPWVTQIAVNACRSHWRKEKLRNLLKSSGMRPEIKSSASEQTPDFSREVELRKVAQEALKSLPPRLREIVVLRFYSGLTYEEMADALKIPLGTAKSRLSFSMMKMRHFIQLEKKQ
ncbi:MAG: RNA polymerase sigma factor [Clostridiales bacterium]|nr:RNA polymerase sigma factor [Clostridiales bacterium]